MVMSRSRIPGYRSHDGEQRSKYELRGWCNVLGISVLDGDRDPATDSADISSRLTIGDDGPTVDSYGSGSQYFARGESGLASGSDPDTGATVDKLTVATLAGLFCSRRLAPWVRTSPVLRPRAATN